MFMYIIIKQFFLFEHICIWNPSKYRSAIVKQVSYLEQKYSSEFDPTIIVVLSDFICIPYELLQLGFVFVNLFCMRII